MTLALNIATTLPSGPNTAYVITRPAGCIPSTSALDTNTSSMDVLDLGTLRPAPKIVSLRVLPTSSAPGHTGIAFNIFGTQPLTPPVFGPGVGVWTHANGIYFDNNGSIYTEVWHINPGTSQASGAWSDQIVIGSWTPGVTMQVDAALYANGEFVFTVASLDYRKDIPGNFVGNPSLQLARFFSVVAASPTDPDVNVRVRASSVNGRTAKLAAFTAGVGNSITVTPVAIFN